MFRSIIGDLVGPTRRLRLLSTPRSKQSPVLRRELLSKSPFQCEECSPLDFWRSGRGFSQSLCLRLETLRFPRRSSWLPIRLSRPGWFLQARFSLLLPGSRRSPSRFRRRPFFLLLSVKRRDFWRLVKYFLRILSTFSLMASFSRARRRTCRFRRCSFALSFSRKACRGRNESPLNFACSPAPRACLRERPFFSVWM